MGAPPQGSGGIGSSTLTAAQVWAFAVRALSTPNDYKADVSLLGTLAGQVAIAAAIAGLNDLSQADILSDATPFQGGRIDVDISSRASAASVAAVAAAIAGLNDLAQADILSDGTPFAGGNIDAAITTRASAAALAALNDLAQADILSDATPFDGADIATILTEVVGLNGDAMRGTDGAALAASWTAALATILANFTAVRIGYLDELDFDLAAAIAAIPTVMVGTNNAALPADVEARVENAVNAAISHSIEVAHGVLEQDVYEWVKSGIYQLSVFMHMDVLEAAVEGGTVTFKLYTTDDGGTNYSVNPVGEAIYVVGTSTVNPSIEVGMLHAKSILRVQCSIAVTAQRTITGDRNERDLGT